MTWASLLLVGIGAAAGAPARYLTDVVVTARTRDDYPWGTLTVNVAGSALLGLVSGAAAADLLRPGALALVGVGFCGAFTTTSAFAWEVLSLAGRGGRWSALGYVGLSLGLGLAVAGAGFWIGAAATR